MVDATVGVQLVATVVEVASVLCLVQSRYLDSVIYMACMLVMWQLVWLCLVIVVSTTRVGDVWAGHLLLAVTAVKMWMFLARGFPNFPIRWDVLQLVVVADMRFQCWMVLLLLSAAEPR